MLLFAAGVFSVLAVVVGQLPGDWGFFGSYLTGGVVIAVLAVGSTAPGLLQFAIDKFSQVFPDYKKRVVEHEAAHFLVSPVIVDVYVCVYRCMCMCMCMCICSSCEKCKALQISCQDCVFHVAFANRYTGTCFVHVNNLLTGLFLAV